MNTDKLAALCQGKEIAEVWQSAGIKAEAKRLREHFQAIAGGWFDRDGLKHIPIYVSLKPKNKLYGKYIYGAGRRAKASIVLYPIRAMVPPPIGTSFTVRDYEGLLSTLCHEYAHHVDPTAGHGARFCKTKAKISARLKEETK